MDCLTGATGASVAAASAADPSTTQGTVALSVMRTAVDTQASAVMQLLQALPQPALATSGSVGTRLNAYA